MHASFNEHLRAPIGQKKTIVANLKTGTFVHILTLGLHATESSDMLLKIAAAHEINQHDSICLGYALVGTTSWSWSTEQRCLNGPLGISPLI